MRFDFQAGQTTRLDGVSNEDAVRNEDDPKRRLEDARKRNAERSANAWKEPLSHMADESQVKRVRGGGLAK